ncbi:coiled-coil domain-containing protein 43 isoform X3 [Octopus sinensis]|uniref:Coiled-coil domain-containing protein 43 n=1 Tax=Octopus sinensis TaxID=2607531 RepID=A0A7E6FLT4_9MOLL|nr:coiled-coil domain-containing protein 43 isoform X3 [Octopus sinensis]
MAAVSMCSDSEGFTRWLEARLLQLNDDLDAGVFVTYINGILESYSGYDEKKDSLLDIVGEIAEDSKEEICDEVIKKWDEMCNVDSKENKKEPNRTPLDERLSKMLTNTHVVTSSTEKKAKQLSEEELAQKRAILVQYSTVCDEPDHSASAGQHEPGQHSEAGEGDAGEDETGQREEEGEGQTGPRSPEEQAAGEEGEREETDPEGREKEVAQPFWWM